ncbi:MAG: CoA-binding protein [Candidatus Omnitrophota bacterium]|jgi:hypothetical protein|nr:CoA-binding protein [Candidatus Omnitrophota bacterium]
MENLIKDFLKQKRFAVAGSFRDESKFAYKIFKVLTGRGYEVFPVNPRISEVDGKVCYKTVSDIPYSVDVVNIVTPPSVTENILKECFRKGIKRVWIQPGAENEAAIKFCKNNNIAVIHSMCVILETLKEEEI